MNEKLRQARINSGLSSAEVAERLGIDRTLYVKYETGARTPNTARLVEIAKVFGVPLVQLTDLPLRGVVTYSDGLLDKLEAANRKIQDLLKKRPADTAGYAESALWSETVAELYERHRAVLDQVISERWAAFDFPDLGVPLDSVVGRTVKEVILDVRGERLIDQGNRLAMDLLNAKYPGVFTSDNNGER